MICPECKSYNVFVHDSRQTNETTRRRRRCLDCGCRFSTIEVLTEEPKKKEEDMKLKVMLDPGAVMPMRAHKTDGGLDLFSRETAAIPPYCSREFDTGVHVAIPEGYVGDVKSKSGLMMKEEITTDGTVDCGYTGSVRVKLFNHGGGVVQIEKGQKIAQLVIKKIITPEPELVDSLDDTERGSGGFGSTGKF